MFNSPGKMLSRTMPIASDDEMEMRGSRMNLLSIDESDHLSRNVGTPTKKLERSMKHSIDVESIPTNLRKSSTEGAIFLFKETEKDAGGKGEGREHNNLWTLKLDLPAHSNGDSRRILEPPLTATRPPSGLQPNRKAQMQQELMSSKLDSPRCSFVSTAFSGSELTQSLDRTSSISSTWSSLDGNVTDEFLDYNEAEQRFLDANKEYADSLAIEMVRREEYPDLGLQRQTYLDYANFALASKFQTEEHTRVVMAEEHCLVNNMSSHLLEHVSDVHLRLLRMFNTSKSAYSVVFTTSYRTAYRLVARAYPFRKGSPLLVCQDNHECVRQLITAAASAGGQPIVAPLGENDLCMTKSSLGPLLKRRFFHPSGSLFVYPAQSNITGIQHSLDWIAKGHKSGWQVLLDVSTLLPTAPLDLSHHLPDFVVGSFENMVGYPSSMGFLLVKRATFCVSVNSIPETDFTESDTTITLTPKVPLWQGEDYHIVCEDEAPPYLLFASLNFGLQHLEKVGLGLVHKRVKALSLWIVHNLKSLRHEDEFWHLVNVYSPFTEENRGNIVSFNVLECNGEHVKPTLVKKIAARYRIALGVGSSINPGVANLLGPSSQRRKNLSVFNELSSDFTCVQVSLGPMSNFEDAYRLVQFLMSFRNPGFVSTQSARLKEASGTRINVRNSA